MRLLTITYISNIFILFWMFDLEFFQVLFFSNRFIQIQQTILYKFTLVSEGCRFYRSYTTFSSIVWCLVLFVLDLSYLLGDNGYSFTCGFT